MSQDAEKKIDVLRNNRSRELKLEERVEIVFRGVDEVGERLEVFEKCDRRGRRSVKASSRRHGFKIHDTKFLIRLLGVTADTTEIQFLELRA